MNKRILKKKNTEGRILYLFDHFCSIPKVALAKYFERYPQDWSKVKNVQRNNFAINLFKSELSALKVAGTEKYNDRISEIRNGHFLRYWKLKELKKHLSSVFEKRHNGIWINAELQEYNYNF